MNKSYYTHMSESWDEQRYQKAGESRVLQCVAVCCIVLQCAVVCYSPHKADEPGRDE